MQTSYFSLSPIIVVDEEIADILVDNLSRLSNPDEQDEQDISLDFGVEGSKSPKRSKSRLNSTLLLKASNLTTQRL